MGISAVWLECLNIKKGNTLEALKYYKGAIKNLYGVYKTIYVKEIVDKHIEQYKKDLNEIG